MPSLRKQQTLEDRALSALLTEVERILNNRPLVPANSIVSTHVALTPGDLLTLRSTNCFLEVVNLREIYVHELRQAKYLTRDFWESWLREYVPTPQARQKWIRTERKFRAGHEVMISDEHIHVGL